MLATDKYMEKTDDDQIQNRRRGRNPVDDDRDAGVRLGGHPGAGRVRILPSQCRCSEFRRALAG